MKKIQMMTAALLMTAAILSACGAQKAESTAAQGGAVAAESSKDEALSTTAATGSAESDKGGDKSSGKAASGAINVISREDGSGTRGAFIELFKIEEKGADGKKVDMTTEDAEITNSTEVMITSVAGDAQSIGYISLGSLNDSVKALKIDGAVADAGEIKAGNYKVARPFNVVYAKEPEGLAADFLKFILSEEGQKVVEGNHYISEGNSGGYTASGLKGKISVAGSSSVTPVMEKLKEAYLALNPGAEIEVQQSDSTTGISSALEGVCDLGMASRELKDSEKEKGVKAQVIALDGIAVIVNKENPLEGLSSEQVKSIYTGEVTDWSELN